MMGGMGDMEEMMMAMMMGGVMSDMDMMMGGGKKKGKGKGKGGNPFMGNPFMDLYDSEDDDDLFGDEKYDSDEIEMIGKQMGLSKSELKNLKADLK